MKCSEMRGKLIEAVMTKMKNATKHGWPMKRHEWWAFLRSRRLMYQRNEVIRKETTASIIHWWQHWRSQYRVSSCKAYPRIEVRRLWISRVYLKSERDEHTHQVQNLVCNTTPASKTQGSFKDREERLYQDGRSESFLWDWKIASLTGSTKQWGNWK